ncbi:nucleotidyltransferase [Caldivirga sp.]|uniref:nucleotidyltransferase n=2 Tax=Caldivirga sp. TaxID=2080243 RepID=UPI003D0B77EE
MGVGVFVDALVRVGGVLRGRGVGFIVVGSLVLPLAYGVDWVVHDVDLFLIGRSTLTDAEFFEGIAREFDWDYGLNAFGGMYYEVVVNGEVVRVDLMENLLDVYIPEAMINDALSIRVNGEEFRFIRIEALIVLKAREATDEAEEFLEKLAEKIADPGTGIELDKERIRKYINQYPEEERESITHKIQTTGIYIE